MTAASDREVIAARAARHDEEFRTMMDAASAPNLTGVERIVAALFTAADMFTSEANDISTNKKKGHVTASKDWRDAAMKVRGLATQLENYGARNPAAHPELEIHRLTEAQADALAILQEATMRVPADHADPAVVEAAMAEIGAGIGQTEPPAWLPTPAELSHIGAVTPDGAAVDKAGPGPANPFRAPLPIDDWRPAEPGETPGELVPGEDQPVPLPAPVAVPEAQVNPFTAPKAPGRRTARLTFPQVLDGLAALPAHVGSSFSQVKTLRGCSMQHAIGRLARNGVVAERPGWAGVGGSALHTAIAAYEDLFESEPDRDEPTDTELGQMWADAYNREILERLSTAGPYSDIQDWYASNRGKENYDWWRVEGRVMLGRYIDSHGPEWAAQFSLRGQEIEYRMDVDGIESHGFVDQVWEDNDGRLSIDDLKSGSRRPSARDPLQLGEYAWALVKCKGIEPKQVADVGFWWARDGQRVVFSDIFDRVPWDALVYWHHSAAARKATPPMPNVTDLCGGCSAKDLCPAQFG